ncbi:MAG: flagellar basal body rod C-terminal domain-containing protein [Candidatus Sericytochromatia bacterium]
MIVQKSKIGKELLLVKVPVGTGSFSAFEELDNTEGSFRPTGNTLDIAIKGNGWLTMQQNGTTGFGGQYTTRNGSFILNDAGEIVNSSGDHLLDINDKKIVIDIPKTKQQMNKDNMKVTDARLSIKENGEIFDNGKKVAQLKIQTDTAQKVFVPALKLLTNVQQVAQQVRTARGSSLVDVNNNKIELKQGYLENSNVQIISEMIGMIHASKNYESGHKLVTSEDKVLDKAINELGRTG